MAYGPVTKDVTTRVLGKLQVRIGNSASNIAVATPVLTASNSLGSLGTTKFASPAEFHTFESGFPKQRDKVVPINENAQIDVAYNEITPFNLALSKGIDPLAAISSSVLMNVAKVSTAGTITGVITVDNAGGVVSDTFVVHFTGATAGVIIGLATGVVHTFAAVNGIIAPDNGGNPYFSIPANFFSGTWANGDTYAFRTTAYVVGTSAYSSAHSGTIAIGTMTEPAFLRVEAVLTYPNGTNTMTVILPRAQSMASIDADFGDDEPAIALTFTANKSDQYTAGGNAAWDNKPLGCIIFA